MQMRVPPKKRKEFSQAIVSLTDSIIETEEGCRRCELYHNLEDTNDLCLIEEWDSRESLESHLNSERFKVLRGAMNLLEEPCKIHSYSSFHEAVMQNFHNPNGNDSSGISQTH